MRQDLRQDPSLEIPVEHEERLESDQLPERYQRNKKNGALGSSLLQSRQFDYTTTECAESIQTTETDTEA